MLHFNLEVLLLSLLACSLVGSLRLHLALLFTGRSERLSLLLLSLDSGAILLLLRVHEQSRRSCLSIA
jgi:hypothetical protein